MKIDRVSVEGFGRLTNQTFEFGSGFNLIFGLNETGKSTLQRAMVALLYGFYSPGRINAAEREMSDMFRPWDETAPYTGSIEYTLTNGQSFRVTRGFENNATTSISTLPENSDITSTFQRQSQGRVFFADEHLGMPKEVFENTSYIRQAELIALNSSANAITDTLMRLSASAASDNTATSAIALLQSIHKDQVGTPRARTKPLAQTRARLSALETERNQLLQKRRALASGLIEINQAKEDENQLTREIEKMRFLEAAASRAELQRKIDAVQQAAQAVEAKSAEVEKWADWAEFPVHLRDDVLKLSDRYRTLQAECQEAKAKAEEATGKLRGLTENIATAKERIGILEDARNTSLDTLADLRKLANQWELARQESQTTEERWQEAKAKLIALKQQFKDKHNQCDPIVRVGYAGLAQLKQAWLQAQKKVSEAEANLEKAQAAWSRTGMSESEFQSLAGQVNHLKTAAVPVTENPRKKGCNLFASNRVATQPSVQVPPEIKIYQELEPIYTSASVARNNLETVQKSLSDIVTNVCQMIGVPERELDENFFAELNQKLEQLQKLEMALRHQRKTYDGLEADLDKARKKENAAQTALKATLVKLGLDTQNLQRAVDNYGEMSKRKAELDRIEIELSKLHLQVQAQEKIIEEWQQKQAQLGEVDSKLQIVLAQAGIEFQVDKPEPVETAVNEFDQRFDSHKRWATAHQQYDLAIKHLENLDSLTDLQNSQQELDNRLAQMLGAQPQLAQLQANEPSSHYVFQLKQLEAKLSKAQSRVRDLQSSIDQSGNNHRHLAEVDEEIKQAATQLQKLEWYGAILEQAQRQLTEATSEFQKQFAPKLENLMSGGLNQITHGRYPNIYVDPTTLAVSVVAPELGQPVSAEFLSTGTRELMYLMLRVSVARLMSRTGEQLPLLLDDPLVQSDQGRQEQTLAYLSQLAEEMQVFLFTKDEWVKGWFVKQFSETPEHKLHVLT